jgi:hypothetical protein
MENTDKSGGTRFSAGKPGMWWAIPMKGLRLVARVTMHGSKKYAPLDWACGQSYSTLLDSASRHWLEVLTDGPLARDEESGEYHLAHCAWNILCLLHFIEQGRDDLDDVSDWQGVTTDIKNQREAQVDTTWIGREAEASDITTGCDGFGNGNVLVTHCPTSPGSERIKAHASTCASPGCACGQDVAP